MTGMLLRQSKHQRPCAQCGNDAFADNGHGQSIALWCGTCQIVACISCSKALIADGLPGLRCPRCRAGGMPIYLNPGLMENSVKTMPPQALDGWPDLDGVVYHKMISHVADHLPVMTAVLKDLIPAEQMPVVVERLCFALATGKYMEWCYNRQEEVRAYTHEKKWPDFPAPHLPQMVELIRSVMAEAHRPEA